MSKKNRVPSNIEVSKIEPKNEKQKDLIDSIRNNEITICSGVAGSGKTYVTLSVALELLDKGYKKIVLIKSVTPVKGEEMGFIPGDVNSKLEPVMMSYKLNLDKIIGGNSKGLFEKKLIEMIPLAYIRGVTIDDSIVIIDEAQQISLDLFKTIVTRIGDNSKYIILGDEEQVDLNKKDRSCLGKIMNMFEGSDLVHVVKFADEDCVRNPIIPKILKIIRENDSECSPKTKTNIK